MYILLYAVVTRHRCTLSTVLEFGALEIAQGTQSSHQAKVVKDCYKLYKVVGRIYNRLNHILPSVSCAEVYLAPKSPCASCWAQTNDSFQDFLSL